MLTAVKSKPVKPNLLAVLVQLSYRFSSRVSLLCAMYGDICVCLFECVYVLGCVCVCVCVLAACLCICLKLFGHGHAER